MSRQNDKTREFVFFFFFDQVFVPRLRTRALFEVSPLFTFLASSKAAVTFEMKKVLKRCHIKGRQIKRKSAREHGTEGGIARARLQQGRTQGFERTWGQKTCVTPLNI